MSYDYDGEKTYSYSEFIGEDFLRDYFNYRRGIMSRLNGISLEDYLRNYEIFKDVKSFDNCVTLSVRFLDEYEDKGDFRYLNASLKINDYLCSKGRYHNIIDTQLFWYVLSREINYIKRLCEGDDVDIWKLLF